ncbi:alkylhydroperoxidase [Salmonella enterica subsp. enterica]|nr:alkylhydroperoxidase [Salmonella enterica subsp. enterica]
MTTLRQPYYELSPEVYSALVQAKKRAGKEHA